MSTQVADPPATAQAPPGPTPAPAPEAPSAPGTSCANCGSPMASGQDWCLQCGAGAPGSLSGAAHSWRSGGIVLGVIVLLVAGAAAAAYAAWGKSSHGKRPATALARTLVTPAATTPGAPGVAGTPGSRALPGTTAGATPTPGLGAIKPPKIPLKQVTPKAAQTPKTATTPASTGTTTSKTTTTPATTGGSGTSELPPAIELDTNAASTYNPYSYLAVNFGDPSLAIDGDLTTGWTAQVVPAVAPKMAEGLVIDLRSPGRIADAKVYTSTTGMTVQVYGANGHAPPGSITDPAWVSL
ncbi:MAG TPA: hypothetical protein VH115_03960, partial [Solirubrobacteraceae bacterium]|nr:hypothetical protein [Solirubrobacteraceae bacterium]